jgi:spermidine synthase
VSSILFLKKWAGWWSSTNHPSRKPSSISLTALVLIAGAVTMSLEFAVGRLLIPIFGSSIYTWGSLIGVILTGLSIGYHVGGRLADKKDPNFLKFCSIIFSAGLYIVFIPFISPAILSSTYSSFVAAGGSSNNESQYASLIATFILLIIPTLLLGIISPYAVKLATTTLARLGNVAGNLYSAATIGSIIGTFVTVFALIPTFAINYIIFGLGLTLIILASIIGLGRLPKILAGSVVLMLFLSNTFLAVNPVSYGYFGNLVYQKETPYAHLDVVDSVDNTQRALFLDGNIHSIMNKQDPTQLLTYTRFFPIGFLFNPTAKHVLFVGGGGFSGPKYFLKTYPDVNVDVVEIDPVVIDVAQKYFNVTKSPRLNIYNDDARDFLTKTSNNQKYDIIILDAFSKNYVPFHLMTLQYYQLLYNKLTMPNGVIVSNQVGSLEGDRSNLYRAAYKTMSQVFPDVYAFPLSQLFPDAVQNIILVGTKNNNNSNNTAPDIRLSKDDIRHREQQQQEQKQQEQLYQHQLMMTLSKGSNNNHHHNNNNISSVTTTTTITDHDNPIDYAEHLYDPTKIRTDDVPTLTDQFAPVENLLNPLTGIPYNIEQKQIPMNTKVDPYSTEGILLTAIIPTIIASIWIFYLQRSIWKGTRQPERIV